MRVILDRLRRPLLAWPGRLETPGLVKRRLLLVAAIISLAVTGLYELGQDEGAPAPWSGQELRDLSGLPEPPVQFAQEEDGTLRRLSPQEYRQLQDIRRLIQRFPVPDAFVNQEEEKRPRKGRGS